MPSNERSQPVSAAPSGEAPAPLKPVATLSYSTGSYRVKARLNLDEAPPPERQGEGAEPLQDGDLDELRRALASLPHLVGTELAHGAVAPPLAPVSIEPTADPAPTEAAPRRRWALRTAIALADIALLVLCISLSTRLGYWDFLRRPEAPWAQRLVAVPEQIAERARPIAAELAASARRLTHSFDRAPAPAEASVPVAPVSAVALPVPTADENTAAAPASAAPADAATAGTTAALPPASLVPDAAPPHASGTPESAPAEDPSPTDAAAKAAVAALLPPSPPAPSDAAPEPAAALPALAQPQSSAPVAAPFPAIEAAPPAAPAAATPAPTPEATKTVELTPPAVAAVATNASAEAAASPPAASGPEGHESTAAPGTATAAAPLFFVQFGAYRTAGSAAHNCAPFAALAPVGVVKGADWYFCRTAAPLDHDAATALVARAKSQLRGDAFLVPDHAG